MSVPFVPPPGFDIQYLIILYIHPDGSVTEMPAEYADGEVWFTTDHFSDFVITYADAPPEPPPVPEDPAKVAERYITLAYVAIIGAVLFLGMYLYVRRN